MEDSVGESLTWWVGIGGTILSNQFTSVSGSIIWVLKINTTRTLRGKIINVRNRGDPSCLTGVKWFTLRKKFGGWEEGVTSTPGGSALAKKGPTF